jgi:3,4-dihydroxy 2-butanone 4-phosphate synthase/GTP cyclohydrolase II
VLHDRSCGRGGDLQAAMREIGEVGRGIVVLIREPQATSLSSRVKAQLEGTPNPQAELRDYGVGAQILFDLGVREMILLSNHKKKTIIGLDGYGLTVVGTRPINPAISGAD